MNKVDIKQVKYDYGKFYVKGLSSESGTPSGGNTPQVTNNLPAPSEENVGNIYYIPKRKAGYNKTLNGYMYIYEPAIVLAPGDTITVYENGSSSSSSGVVAIVKITSSIEYLAYSSTSAPRSATYTNNTSDNITVYLASSVGISEAVDYQVIKADGSTEYDIYQLIKDSNDALEYVALTADVSTDDKEDKVAIETPVDTTDPTDPITSLTCEVSKYYRVDVAVDTLAVTLPAVEDTAHVNSITIMLTAGTTPAITFTAQAIGGTTPDVYTKSGFEIEAGKTYEISALFNGSAWVLTSVEIDVTSNS